MASEVHAVAADIPMGISQVEEGDAKVLFVRDQTGLRAFQASCPHAGAPLAEGRLCGRTLYCPWHKGAFDIGDGALLQPPPLAALDQYPIRTEGEKVVVTLEPMARNRPSPRAHDDRTVVIVGTGAAASVAAMTLREEGYGGRIRMVAAEAGEPYDRTMLSKDFLGERMDPSDVALEEGFFDKYAVEVVQGPAARIEPSTRAVRLDDGTTIEGDALLIATGSVAARPAFAETALGNVFTLRSLADAESMTEAIEAATDVAIIGSGFIALEAAAFLTQRGKTVTVVSRDVLPLATRLGDDIGHAIKIHLEGIGVRFIDGAAARLDGNESVRSIRLEGGSSVSTDLVLVAAGAVPNTKTIDWTKNADGSVAVDERLQIAPGVWVVGDIADFPLHDGRRARIEHWRVAEQHGRHAARAILGAKDAFAAAPFFWTRQGDVSLSYAGYAHEWDEIVIRGKPAKLDFIAYYVRDGKALAASAVGHDDVFIDFLHALDGGRTVQASELQ